VSSPQTSTRASLQNEPSPPFPPTLFVAETNPLTISGFNQPTLVGNMQFVLTRGVWLLLSHGCWESVNSTALFRTSMLLGGSQLQETESAINPGNAGDDFTMANTTRVDIPEDTLLQYAAQTQGGGNWRRLNSVMWALRVRDLL
jgi:hypothetical protein